MKYASIRGCFVKYLQKYVLCTYYGRMRQRKFENQTSTRAQGRQAHGAAQVGRQPNTWSWFACQACVDVKLGFVRRFPIELCDAGALGNLPTRVKKAQTETKKSNQSVDGFG